MESDKHWSDFWARVVTCVMLLFVVMIVCFTMRTEMRLEKGYCEYAIPGSATTVWQKCRQ